MFTFRGLIGGIILMCLSLLVSMQMMGFSNSLSMNENGLQVRRASQDSRPADGLTALRHRTWYSDWGTMGFGNWKPLEPLGGGETYGLLDMFRIGSILKGAPPPDQLQRKVVRPPKRD